MMAIKYFMGGKSMGKRGHNEGSIRKRKDGTWEARYTIGRKLNGTINRKSVYAPTRKIAAEKLAKALNELNEGKYVEGSKISVQSWLNDWIFTYKKHSVKASTYQIMETLIRNQIVGTDFGKKELKELKHIHVQKFYNTKQDILSPNTVKRMHVFIKQSFDMAIENKMLAVNPANKILLPKVIKKEIEIFTVDQQKKFIELAKQHKYRSLFILALQTGMRIGELLSLKWTDIGPDRCISIKRTIKRVKTNFNPASIENKTSVIISSPKTNASIRKVPLMDTANKEIEYHRTYQDKLKDDHQDIWIKKSEDWIFTTGIGTTLEARRVVEHFKKLLKAAELPNLSFHALRHTFVSRMIEAGADIKTISEIIGHTSVSFTLDTYGHILKEQKISTINKINNIFEENDKSNDKSNDNKDNT